jgi:hypothetical protein
VKKADSSDERAEGSEANLAGGKALTHLVKEWNIGRLVHLIKGWDVRKRAEGGKPDLTWLKGGKWER